MSPEVNNLLAAMKEITMADRLPLPAELLEDDLGFSSIDLVELRAWLEVRIGSELPDGILVSGGTVQSVIDLYTQSIKDKGTVS